MDAHICSKQNTLDETGSTVTKDTAKENFDCEQFKFVSLYKGNLPTHMAKQHKKRKETIQEPKPMKQARIFHWEECPYKSHSEHLLTNGVHKQYFFLTSVCTQ